MQLNHNWLIVCFKKVNICFNKKVVCLNIYEVTTVLRLYEDDSTFMSGSCCTLVSSSYGTVITVIVVARLERSATPWF